MRGTEFPSKKDKEGGNKVQKIKSSVVTKMIEKGITSKEFDFLIYISRFQDDAGNINGVHYKEVCENMNISYQGFYDIKKSLMIKGIIQCNKSNYIDHDIMIKENDFSYVENFTESYINTNHDIFFDPDFFKMKAGAKLLTMEMMKISYSNRGKVMIGVKKFFDKYCQIFKVTKRVMHGYLMQLKRFFSIGIKDGKYYITPLVKIYNHGQPSENDRYSEHQIKTICRRNRMEVSDQKAVKDIGVLAGQYRKTALNAGMNIWDILKTAIKESLERLNLSYKTYKIRVLKPKLIHKIVKEKLALA